MSKVPRILRAPTADNSSPVLVYVEPNFTKGLDFKLYATDGNNVYVLSEYITSQNASKFKAQSYQANDKQWQAALSWFFLHEQPSQELLNSLGNAEVVSYIKPEKSLELRIRQHVSGITQRMGSITLDCNDELEISLFDWANIAAGGLETAQVMQGEMQTKGDSQRETIEKLRKQLEELVEAKKTHEDQMLEKFRQLLNTKKLKIRDQQRLLATATIDAGTAREISAERGGTRTAAIPPTTMPARGEKRRAMYEDDDEVKQEVTSPEEDMSEDEELARKQATPDASEEETEDEDESAARASRPATSREKPKDANAKIATLKKQQEPFDWQLPERSDQATTSTTAIAVDDEDTEDEL